METAKQHNDKLIGVCEVCRAYSQCENYKPLNCQSCRAQIEQETRQKCWKDVDWLLNRDDRKLVSQMWEIEE